MNSGRMSSQECSRVTDDRAAIRRAGFAEAVNPADTARNSEPAMFTSHSASTNDDLSPQPTAAGQAYKDMMAQGFTPDEAGTLMAYLEGLDMAHHSWTLREVNGLLFIRHLNRTGAFGDDRTGRAG